MTRVFWIGMIAGAWLFFAAAPVAAQSADADSYFHEAAQAYVDGNMAAARRAVEQGLAVAPSDPRLVALRNKLEQGGRPQGERDSSSSASSQQSQDEGDSASSEESDENDEASPSEERGTQRSGSRNDQSSGAEQSGTPSSSQRSSDASQPAQAQRRSGTGRPVDTLSRAQAERLLQALEGQEQKLLRRIQVRSADRTAVEKDW